MLKDGFLFYSDLVTGSLGSDHEFQNLVGPFPPKLLNGILGPEYNVESEVFAVCSYVVFFSQQPLFLTLWLVERENVHVFTVFTALRLEFSAHSMVQSTC